MRKIAVRAALLLCCAVAPAYLVSQADAAPIADSIAFQGRLLDAADQPVTGNLDVIFSLWSDSTGGTQLWTQTLTVAIQKGLFSTCLGCGSASFFDVFTTGDLFLQTQLGGQPAMSPRTRIRNTPRALVSSRVSGDITTSPQRVVVGDLNGDGMLDLVSSTDQSEMRLAHKRPGRVKYSNIILRAMQDSVSDSRDCDSDDDGIPESEYSQRLTPTTSSLAIKTKGTGAQRYSTGGDCDDTDARLHADCDVDGDGAPDVVVAVTANDTGASNLLSGGADPNQSAIIESFVHRLDDRSLLGLKTYQPGRPVYGNITFETGHAMTRNFLDCDDDGDGLSDSRLTLSTGHGGGGAGGSILLEADLDGDGLAESSVSQSNGSEGSSLSLDTRAGLGGLMGPRMSTNLSVGRQTPKTDFGSRCYVDDDTIPDDEISQVVMPGTCSVAINTKGTGADKGRTSSITTGTGLDSAVCVSEVTDGSSHSSTNMRTRLNELEAILKNIGLLTSVVSGQSCTDTGASTSSTVDLNNDGNQDVVVSSSVSKDRSELKGHFETGDIPTQQDFSTLLDSRGVRLGLQVSSTGQWSSATTLCTADSVSHEISVLDASGNGMKVKEKGNRTKCTSNMRVITPTSTTGRDDDCDDISSRTAWSSTSGGTTSSVTIEAADGVDPILHSSGAKLTAGGVWTNASDANLKENFQPVDGQQILDKVDALPITEWNYKTESDDAKHIGPTAQDFQQVFGVGSDGHSISTIDPSGIALAAIKELNKKVKEVDQLKSELRELKALVEKLAADNAQVKGSH